ncbi:MAG: glycerophosphodiester phosphodiesterase [Paenibacillaceae bacterium]|jgi:glycerophosphoryl diester phosphodiesterase|nr:glycerophosphodiester phosphodiesterase [Paenibacillaceae bacterium]
MAFFAIAHRGYPVKYPENTLSSFQAAVALSPSHVELDVHLSKDGVPVVMHDHTINRTSNGKGRIKDYTLAELKQFRLSEVETIPTLEEALRVIKGHATVLVELKQAGHLYDGLEAKTLEVIRKLDMIDQVLISSFNHLSLEVMRSLTKDVRFSLLLGGPTTFVFDAMKQVGATHLSIPYNYLTREYVTACKERGFQLLARVVDSEEVMEKMLEYPGVLYCTNQLERFKQFCETHRFNLV